VIPEGWSLCQLSDLSSKISDGLHSTPKYTESSDYYFINGNNLKNGSVVIGKTTKCVSKEEAQKHKRDLTNRTILMSINGTIGSLAYYQGEKVVLGKSAAYINVKKSVDTDFVYYFLSTSKAQRFFKSELTGTTIRNLSLKSIKSVKVLLPPLPEQKKIAQILSTWDNAIETVEKLIENSQQKKKALMQQLLTGKKRFPGFDGEWKEIRLGDVGEVSSAGVDKKIVESEEPVRLLNYLDILNRDFIKSDQLNHWVTAPDRKVQNCNIHEGDVFFTPSSETRDDIAHSAVATETIPKGVYSYHIVRFRLRENWDLLFRTYAFKTPSFYKQAYSLCEGSGQRYVISQRYFRNMRVRIPTDIDEQRKIATALSTAHREIETWQQELEHLKQEKKALMQQLLTGKRRVKVV